VRLVFPEAIGDFWVGVWKSIRRGWQVFSTFVRYEVRDGSKIRFWYDLWCGDYPLKSSFF